MPDERITLKDAAERFGVPIERLRKAAQRERLSAVRVGAGQHAIWMAYPDDVAQYLSVMEAQRSGPRKTKEPQP